MSSQQNHFRDPDQVNKATYKLVVYFDLSSSEAPNGTFLKVNKEYANKIKVYYGYHNKPDRGLAGLIKLGTNFLGKAKKIIIYEKSIPGSNRFDKVYAKIN